MGKFLTEITKTTEERFPEEPSEVSENLSFMVMLLIGQISTNWLHDLQMRFPWSLQFFFLTAGNFGFKIKNLRDK